MLDIPVSVRNLLEQDRVRKNFRARFPNGELPDITNKDIVEESVRFTESICSQDVLKFGMTESSVIEFETVGVGNMYGMMIECFCEVDVSSLSDSALGIIRFIDTWDGELIELEDSDIGYSFFRIPYGVFRVESCPRNQEAMTHRRVTGYSLNFSKLSRNFSNLPEIAAWSSFIVDPAAFYDQLDESRLVETEVDLTKAKTSYVGGGLLASKVGLFYDLRSGVDTLDEYEILNCDFVKVDIQYDAAAYEAEGMKVVKALEDAGYDFTISSGLPYPSTEAAVRDRYPMLFAPVLDFRAFQNYTWPDGDVTESNIGTAWSQTLKNGRLEIVCGYEREPRKNTYDYAFSGKLANAEITKITPVISYCTERVSSVSLLSFADSDFKVRVNVQYPPVTINYIKKYSRQNSSGIKVQIPSTAAAQTVPLYGTYGKAIQLLRYSYVEAMDRQQMLDSYLELNAMFGKVDRHGKIVGLRLSTEKPIEIMPEKYSGFWWDEFDVAPIGSVMFNYPDGEDVQTSVYTFGAGASVYDLGDNAVINSLEGASQENIQALLDQYFIPHLLPVAFTPIELNMQGLPYIEDGDYLKVTAADGTEAFSFNMRHELSGIQFLEAEVTSVSGQIIDSEVET